MIKIEISKRDLKKIKSFIDAEKDVNIIKMAKKVVIMANIDIILKVFEKITD